MQSGSVVGGSCSIAGLTRVVPIVFGVSISNRQHGDEIIQFLCPKKKVHKTSDCSAPGVSMCCKYSQRRNKVPNRLKKHPVHKHQKNPSIFALIDLFY